MAKRNATNFSNDYEMLDESDSYSIEERANTRYILTRMIDGIFQISGHKRELPHLYIDRIETLQRFLESIADTTYHHILKKVNQKYQLDFQSMPHDRQQLMAMPKAIEYADEIFSVLMKLAQRRNILFSFRM